MGALSAFGPVLTSGNSIWEYEWDVLVLLDACRVDALKTVAPEYDFLPSPDQIDSITSVGSCTPGWMSETFAPDYATDLQDTGYVSANPHTASNHGAYANLPIESSQFALLDEVWKTNWNTEGTPTVAPDSVTEHGIAAWQQRRRFGMDRLIIHYLQPHRPYRTFGYEKSNHPSEATVGATDEAVENEEGLLETNRWQQLSRGEIDKSTMWNAYVDNLHWVLESISDLVANLNATVVLSADHGEAFGEWGIYEHPPKSPVPEIRQVPWVELETTDNGEYNPAVSFDKEGLVESEIREHRLKQLGYLDR
jgi:hypothetical protein